MGIIKAKQLVHEYIRRDEEGNVESIQTALDHVDLDVKQGDFIAILGHNGSGKSTLAKHINALLAPSEGSLFVDGMDVSKEENVIPVRKTAGMVFQNPDNQIIASVVEEDVGFGPENIGVPTDEIWQRVEESLKAVGMLKYRHHSPNKLSGGQKQRLTIARALVSKPEILILDDSLSALDFATDAALRKAIGELEGNVTTFLVSQRISGIRQADKILVMEDGELAGQGTHEELMETCETYQEIYYSQFPEERPAAVKSSKETGKDLDKADKMTEKAEKGAAE